MDYLNKKNLKDLNISGKTVILRCDFNVPLDEKGTITNQKRIEESLPTINYILNKNAKLVICSHLSKPKGEYDQKFSLAPVANCLSRLLNKPVKLATDVVGVGAQELVKSLNYGEICMLENLRFEPGEQANDLEFSEKLSSLAEIYVNDAFGTCHRSHASTVGIAKFLPSAYGFLIEKEILAMNKILKSPKKPLVAILGGAKVSDKIDVINFLLDKVDYLIIGGGMSYTFMNALGYSVGNSICESEKISFVKDMMAKAKEKGVKILLPLDIKVASEFSANAESKIVDSDKIPENWMGMDIGPKTIENIETIILNAGTIVWNGPMGVFEWPNFEFGTREIAKLVAKSNAISIIGGGDSVAAIEKFDLERYVTHLSTGGGAFLRFIEGKALPALEAINEK